MKHGLILLFQLIKRNSHCISGCDISSFTPISNIHLRLIGCLHLWLCGVHRSQRELELQGTTPPALGVKIRPREREVLSMYGVLLVRFLVALFAYISVYYCPLDFISEKFVFVSFRIHPLLSS